MTSQAVLVLLEWAHDASWELQQQFATYLAKEMETHYKPKGLDITGRTMEAMIENWENEKATASKQ